MIFWVICGIFEDLFHLNCVCNIFVDACLSLWRRNVGFIDVIAYAAIIGSKVVICKSGKWMNPP